VVSNSAVKDFNPNALCPIMSDLLRWSPKASREPLASVLSWFLNLAG
jgi:hypothetical protein